jgi:hypothetical protein
MGHTFVLLALLKFFVVAGFAYVIWLLALKENATLKIIGQIIAIAILIFIVLATVLAGHAHRQHRGGHFKGGCMMTGMKSESSEAGTVLPGQNGWHKHDRHGMVKEINAK